MMILWWYQEHNKSASYLHKSNNHFYLKKIMIHNFFCSLSSSTNSTMALIPLKVRFSKGYFVNVKKALNWKLFLEKVIVSKYVGHFIGLSFCLFCLFPCCLFSFVFCFVCGLFLLLYVPFLFVSFFGLILKTLNCNCNCNWLIQNF